jgi:hypothetical protein
MRAYLVIAPMPFPLFVLGFELSGNKVLIVDSFRESYSARFYACQAERPCRYFIGVKAQKKRPCPACARIIAVSSPLAPIDPEAYRWPVARQGRQWRCGSATLFVYNCEFAIDYFMSV